VLEVEEPYQIAFDNEFVRIVQVTLDAGKTPPKYTPAALPMVRIIFESDHPRLPPGSTHYCESAPDDRGHTLREIRVELKSAPSATPMKLDAVRVDPDRYRIDFENDRLRIVRLGFGPHERGLMVEHPPRVLATLTDVAVKLLFADGHTDERGAPRGVAAWLDGETLQTENAGDNPLEVVLIEPKAPDGANFSS
jgi:hypothetical protein